MRRSFSFRFFAVFGACSMALCSLHADVLELKSGEKIEGKILSETATDVVIEYNITPKIKDTKTLSKQDIAKMVKLTPSQMEFLEQKLNKVLPSEDLLTAANYEELIQDRIRPFINRYPDTPEAKEAEKIIVELTAEKERVLKGEIKVEGQWLDPDTAKSDVYNIQAYRLRKKMNDFTKVFTETSHLNGLREFDLIRANYPASLQYVSAIPEALEHIDQYEKYLLSVQRNQPVLAQQRDAALKGMAARDAQVIKDTIAKEQAALKAIITADTKAGIRWLPIDKYDAKSISDALKALDKARTELLEVNLEAIKRQNTIYTSIQRAIALDKEADARRLFNAIKPEQVVDKKTHSAVDAQIKALTEELKKRAPRNFGGAGSTMTSNADGNAAEGEGTNPIAEELKKAEEKKKAEAKLAAEKKAEDEKRAAAAAAAAAAAQAQEEGLLDKIAPFFPHIGGGLVVLLLLSFVLGKKKKG